MDYEIDIDVFDEEDEAEDVLEILWYDQYLMARVGPLMNVVSKVISIVEVARA